MSSHFITVCSCGAVIAQCRCPDPNKTKTVVPNGCGSCKKETATPEEQLKADRNLVKRIDEFGKRLSPYETGVIESFTRWLEGGRPLTENQRKLAEDIDNRRVG